MLGSFFRKARPEPIAELNLNNKPTVGVKRTREPKDFFELNNVPVGYQGNQALYMVITNDRGVSIP